MRLRPYQRIGHNRKANEKIGEPLTHRSMALATEFPRASRVPRLILGRLPLPRRALPAACPEYQCDFQPPSFDGTQNDLPFSIAA
jgi:hypothetical protein